MDRRKFLRKGTLATAGAALIPTVFLEMAGCRKDLLDTTPYGDVSSETMWTTDNFTDLGVNGVYQVLRFGGVCGNSLYAMDRYGFCSQERDSEALLTGNITTTGGLFSSTWQNLYEGIHRANDAIANIPEKSPSADDKKARYVAECKFLRAYFYFSLNRLFKGVPIYLEPITDDQAVKGRNSEEEVWKAVIDDLTEAIGESNLPDKYDAGDAHYGHVTKGAAYALRGKAYMYQKEYDKAASDFNKVKGAGYALFTGSYADLFKQSNEQSDEMIFSVQNMGQSGYGSDTQWRCGTRSSFGSCWNTYLVTPHVVDLYENKDGSSFNWEDIIPGYSSLTPKEREVYFLRDGLTSDEKQAAQTRGAKMSAYLDSGNEARIKQAYKDRDPRLAANVITPYSSYVGAMGGADHTVYSRWPYRQESAPVNDLRTDTQTYFYYLHRKFVYEGVSGTPNRNYCPTDFPLIRYADVLLMWAEAENEGAGGSLTKAIDLVNQVRSRVGMPDLQNNDSSLPTYVSGKENLRERIQNERRVEFVNEGINFFDELRWKTWKEKVFDNDGGIKQIWGDNVVDYDWKGDYIYDWAIPQTEIERNSNLEQNSGWIG